MKPCVHHIVLFITMFVIFTAKSQTPAQYYCSVGGAYSVIRDQVSKKWDNSGFQYSIGFVSEKQQNTRHVSFCLGVFYTNSIIRNFENYHFDYSTQANVHLSTDIVRHDIQLQQLVTMKLGKMKYGGGFLFSYLLSSNINQKVIGEYTPLWRDLAYETEYTIDNNRSRSPLTRVNVAPCLNIEYPCSYKFLINLRGSYSIFPNPKIDYKFNSFNSLDLSLSLAYRLNKTP
jgi:hypothetical protein